MHLAESPVFNQWCTVGNSCQRFSWGEDPVVMSNLDHGTVTLGHACEEIHIPFAQLVKVLDMHNSQRTRILNVN